MVKPFWRITLFNIKRILMQDVSLIIFHSTTDIIFNLWYIRMQLLNAFHLTLKMIFMIALYVI